MALQSRINEIYPNRKPFMEPVDGKRKATGKDLRVQALLGAQEAAKRQCTDGGVPQEQQPPMGDFQQQDGTDQTPPTDFSGFFNQLQKDKQTTSRASAGILQDSPQQNSHPLDTNVQRHCEDGAYQQQQQCLQDNLGAFGAYQTGMHQQQQQQQHHHQQQQHMGLSTLDQLLTQHDLGSRHKLPDRDLAQMMSLDRVFGADASSRDGFTSAAASTGNCNRSNSSATAAAAAAAAAAKEQQSWHLTQMPYIPWDWSVKSSVRFSSPQPFNVLEEQQAEGLDCLCHAVAVAGGAVSAGAGAASTKQARLQQALMQWQHPSAPLPPAMLAAAQPGSSTAAAPAAAAAGDRSKGNPAALLLHERAQQWREALRGAYVALRHGHCPVIYVCGQAFKQPFTAALCSPGVNNSSSKFTAVISRTNRLLRAHLATYGCEGLVAGQLEQQAAGQQQQRHGKQQQLSAGAFDGQPGSQLLLVGVQHVHGLYAALQALPWCEPGQPDVPLLSAPVPFLHAQLCPLRLEALPDVLLDNNHHQQQQRASDTAAAGGPLPLHYVELRAPSSIMPWTLHRLLGLLQDSQGLEGFQAYLTTEPCSSSLNALPELWAAAAAGGGGGVGAAGGGGGAHQQQQWRREGRGFAAAEVERWGCSAVLLHGRVLRQLRLEEGSVAAKLS